MNADFNLTFLLQKGVEPAVTYNNLGLPSEWYGALEWVFPTWARAHALDRGEAVNILKGAIVTVDRILTVSQVRCVINYIYYFGSLSTSI